MISLAVVFLIATPIEAQTHRAKRNSVRVDTVSLGGDADQGLMPCIATETGGAHYCAAEHSELTAVSVDILNLLPAIQTP
jgi:hypothetical protein